MSECSVQALKWGATWPSREQFHELADQGYRVIPIVRRLLADSMNALLQDVPAHSFLNPRNLAARGTDTASSV